uniref:Uncharacterized protein n=1 Tax=Anguilla anguilla TaxID=7936 RepID=A0A0E9XBT4_ANGAN
MHIHSTSVGLHFLYWCYEAIYFTDILYLQRISPWTVNVNI